MALILRLLESLDEAEHTDESAEYIRGSLQCQNPSCITSVEQELEHIFKITDKENHICRCIYCERKELIKEM